MFYVEQFWGGEKLGKANKLKAHWMKKNIKKLIDNFKKRVLRESGRIGVKSG